MLKINLCNQKWTLIHCLMAKKLCTFLCKAAPQLVPYRDGVFVSLIPTREECFLGVSPLAVKTLWTLRTNTPSSLWVRLDGFKGAWTSLSHAVLGGPPGVRGPRGDSLQHRTNWARSPPLGTKTCLPSLVVHSHHCTLVSNRTCVSTAPSSDQLPTVLSKVRESWSEARLCHPGPAGFGQVTQCPCASISSLITWR